MTHSHNEVVKLWWKKQATCLIHPNPTQTDSVIQWKSSQQHSIHYISAIEFNVFPFCEGAGLTSRPEDLGCLEFNVTWLWSWLAATITESFSDRLSLSQPATCWNQHQWLVIPVTCKFQSWWYTRKTKTVSRYKKSHFTDRHACTLFQALKHLLFIWCTLLM